MPTTLSHLSHVVSESFDLYFEFLGLPKDFFDSQISQRKMAQGDGSWKREPSPEPVQPPKPNSTEILPEGFFDDPKEDAKVFLNILV